MSAIEHLDRHPLERQQQLLLIMFWVACLFQLKVGQILLCSQWHFILLVTEFPQVVAVVEKCHSFFPQKCELRISGTNPSYLGTLNEASWTHIGCASLHHLVIFPFGENKYGCSVWKLQS